MNCLQCGESADRDRVLVMAHTDLYLGGYCTTCEREDFGKSLERGTWEERTGCLLCEGRGTYALPLYEIEFVETDHGEQRHVGYTVTDRTPRLCRDHTAELFDLELDDHNTEQVPLTAAASEQYELKPK